MLPSLSFLGAAAAVLLLAPLVLTMGRWQVRLPRIALTLWFGAFFSGVGLAVCSIAAAILAGVGAASAASATEATAVTLAAWLSLGVVGGVLAIVSSSAEPFARSWRASVDRLAPVAVARESRRGFTLVWFASDAPIACAVPSRSPEILVSTGLRDALTGPQLQAVIAHEYAHLRQRHGWAVRIAEINALCVPRRLRAGHALRRATLLLVELIADDSAAQQAGAVHLANALTVIGRSSADPGMQLRAERLALRSWPPASACRVPGPIRIRPTAPPR